MVKARILVSGNLRLTGYRVLVRQIAYSLGITGSVSIHKNGMAEIWCEGEKHRLGLFRQMIEVRQVKTDDVENGQEKKLGSEKQHLPVEPMEHFRLFTENLTVFVEGSPGFQGAEEGALCLGQAPTDWESFCINYGPDVGTVEQELLENQEVQQLLLTKMLLEISVISKSLEEANRIRREKARIRSRN